MAKTAMTVEEVGILAAAYPDPLEWERVSHETTEEGAFLVWPDDLSPPISSVDLPAARRSYLLAYAKLRRWQIETGGVEVGEMTVATDDRSKQMITGARIAADNDPDFETEWDLGTTDVTLNAEQIIAISDAVRDHVAAVFAKFKTIRAGVNADEIASKSQIDAAFAAS